MNYLESFNKVVMNITESRELDVDLTFNGLHEDVNTNGYEFRSLSKKVGRK